MKRVNEIFYSLQGEGFYTGRAAVFVRFSGCNLRCPFCDTSFEDYREMDSEEILQVIRQYPARFVVLTGGEPALQVDEEFTACLHRQGYEIAMETNGTRAVPRGIDWLTVSPKISYCTGAALAVDRCNELKCLFDGVAPVSTCGIIADHYYLQPCDVGDVQRNRLIMQQCVEYVCRHPRWRLSLQTHKMAGFK
ncbi:MAG: 7-carboxy-7-deazaguanine synthase QueE [Prevotella sp.]